MRPAQRACHEPRRAPTDGGRSRGRRGRQAARRPRAARPAPWPPARASDLAALHLLGTGRVIACVERWSTSFWCCDSAPLVRLNNLSNARHGKEHALGGRLAVNGDDLSHNEASTGELLGQVG